LPQPFARVHPRYLTPSFSTPLFGGIAIVLYASMNYLGTRRQHQSPIAVTALGMLIAFYYGLTGFAVRVVLTARIFDSSSAKPLDAGHPARRSGG
jgi:amino acid transporter